jgi:hypothetical protein
VTAPALATAAQAVQQAANVAARVHTHVGQRGETVRQTAEAAASDAVRLGQTLRDPKRQASEAQLETAQAAIATAVTAGQWATREAALANATGGPALGAALQAAATAVGTAAEQLTRRRQQLCPGAQAARTCGPTAHTTGGAPALPPRRLPAPHVPRPQHHAPA